MFRAMNGRSAARVGTMQFPGMGGQFRYPIGYDAYLMYVAMWGQRFSSRPARGEPTWPRWSSTGASTRSDNERAVGRRPLDLDLPGVAHGRGTLPGRRLHRGGGRCLRVGGHVARPGP